MAAEWTSKQPHPNEPDNENLKIKINIYYTKGVKYWVSVVPVKITKHDGYSIEEFGAYTGFNQNILVVNRKSSKKLQEAIKIVESEMEQYLNYFKT